MLPLAILLAAGCASRPATQSDPSATSSRIAPADSSLARAAAKNLRSPDARAIGAPLPAGLPVDLSEPLDPAELDRARLALDDALGLLRASAPAETEPAPIERTPSDAERLEAVRGYVIGRAQRLAEENTQAEATLKNAARLDDSSAPIWRELAEAQDALGNRAASLSAFRRTLALAPNDIAALDALSRAAIERGEWADAARLLDRLRALPLDDNDPAFPYLVSARLGRALAGLGHITASLEAMKQALDLPQSFGETTRFQAELGLLYRQRGDLWRDAGDGMLRLNDPAKAAECYERAATLPNLNPSAMTPRRVYAQMRLGRPADAAAIVIDSIMQHKGRADDRLLALLRYVASNSTIGQAAAETIDSYAANLDDQERAAASGGLIRAKAACLGMNDAIRLLAEHLRSSPADDAALRDLFARADRTNPQATIDVTLDLIAASPLQESRFVRAALAGEADSSRLSAALASLPADRAVSPAARLLRARLLEAAGDYPAAERELAELMAAAPHYPAAVAARTSLLWRLGRTDEARALIDTLSESADADARNAKLLALTEIGDYDSASALITPMLPDLAQATAADVDRLLLAAKIRMLSGEFIQAERLLQTIVILESTRDEAYSALLNLYSRSGPLASEQKLVAIIRTLRDNSPSSPTLRFLRAQESLQRGQLDIAERDLLDLSDESPIRAGVVEGLIRLWKNLGQFERAETWLREQSERRADEPAFTVQLALLLEDRGRRPEAISALESRLARMPGDDQSSRVLEAFLRENPSQLERAQTLTRARLARSPRTSEAMVELAELSAASGQFEEATEAVRRTIDPNRPLRRDLVERLAKLVVEESADALRGKSKIEAVLGLQRAVVDAAPDSPPGVYIVAVQLLARSGAPLQTIYDTIDAGSQRHPSRRTELFSAAYDALIRPGTAELRGEKRADDADDLAEHACRTTKPPPLLLHAVWTLQSGWSRDRDFESCARSAAIARDTETIDALADEMAKGLRHLDGSQFTAADVAYELAGRVNQTEDNQPLVEWLYRVALRHEPEHLWANNNLGYSLLEEDRDIEGAVRMIETAYRVMRADPKLEQRASIIDSMGWAQYKRGRFVDEVGPDGMIVREGAVTLLSRAKDQMEKDKEESFAIPILQDHLADALWAAGEREKAIAMWTSAAERTTEILKEIASRLDEVSPRVLAEIESAGTRSQSKASAARSDQEPAIAKFFPQELEPAKRDAAAPAGMIQ